MEATDSLGVWWDADRVGLLFRDASNRMGFRYDESWLRGRGRAISTSLPLRTDPFPEQGATAHRFFANLLPEGAARSAIVRRLGIADTDFDLLCAIGGECAGALTILQIDRAPLFEGRYRELDSEGFARYVRARGALPEMGRTLVRSRLSLAGAQDKCALLRRGETWFEPLGDAASTHILKFDSKDYSNVLVYEAFLTALARAVGLRTVEVELDRVDPRTRFLRVRRYDREVNDQGDISRLHQEDFCQALGIGHERKYEHDGGSSFADCIALVRARSIDPANDVEQLLRWQIFNAVAGNSDGHAKNLSFLHGVTGARLAPFYDLVCTRAIARIDARLAFSIGGQRRPADLERRHWQAFATDCDVGRRFLLGLVRETIDSLDEARAPTRAAFESRNGPTPALQRVERVVATQSMRLRRTLGQGIGG